MKKIIIAFILMFPLSVLAAGGTYPLDPFQADLKDKISLQNGAKTFVNYCMGCHSAKYSRYERVAVDLGIPLELAEEHLIFDNETRIGDLMEVAMPEKLAKKWFGAAPLDLTLVARARSPEWLYTYLRTFYKDPSRPYGVNNMVFPSVGMPHVLLELQGLQECVPDIVDDGHGDLMENPCASFKLGEPGKLSVDEYDQLVYDLVNFLEYVGEPMALERKQIGIYVMLFLFIFLIPAWFLNREYWKNIH
jgi:ubiquinol-cytochrome c reductase cytochrome b subunit